MCERCGDTKSRKGSLSKCNALRSLKWTHYMCEMKHTCASGKRLLVQRQRGTVVPSAHSSAVSCTRLKRCISQGLVKKCEEFGAFCSTGKQVISKKFPTLFAPATTVNMHGYDLRSYYCVLHTAEDEIGNYSQVLRKVTPKLISS